VLLLLPQTELKRLSPPANPLPLPPGALAKLAVIAPSMLPPPRAPPDADALRFSLCSRLSSASRSPLLGLSVSRRQAASPSPGVGGVGARTGLS
jgi:hypothetical protein